MIWTSLAVLALGCLIFSLVVVFSLIKSDKHSDSSVDEFLLDRPMKSDDSSTFDLKHEFRQILAEKQNANSDKQESNSLLSFDLSPPKTSHS